MDYATGAQASRLPFASAAMQTIVARKYAQDKMIRSPRHASGVARARGKRDACAPVFYSNFRKAAPSSSARINSSPIKNA